jgi:hypothetical protein
MRRQVAFFVQARRWGIMAYIRLDGVSLKLPVYDGAMMWLIRLSSYRRAKIGSTAVSYENIRLVVQVYKWPKGSIYSAGTVARLAHAMATQQAPDALLIDEDIGAGHARFQAKTAEALTRNFFGRAKVVLLASIAPELCRAIRTHALHFLDGRLVFLGDIDGAFNRPTNMRRGGAA